MAPPSMGYPTLNRALFARGILTAAKACRLAARHRSMDVIWRDFGYAVRLLRRQPGFAAVAILTMALGIGATTMLFTVVYGVLLKPLPWPDADRLVRVTETRGGRSGRVAGTLSNGTFLAWRDHS